MSPKVLKDSVTKLRKIPTPKQRQRLLKKNAGVCCVCKQWGLGVHLHHIDGDSSNTGDDNLAVLCVKDHDVYHRPIAYTSPNHLELGAQRIKGFKESWEAFVAEAAKPNPAILCRCKHIWRPLGGSLGKIDPPMAKWNLSESITC